MRLPKVLAVAVTTMLMAGGGSAVALTAQAAGRQPGALAFTNGPGRDGISGVAVGSSHLARSASGSAGQSGSASAASSSGDTSSTSALSGRRAGAVPPPGYSVPAGGAPVSSGQDPVGPSTGPGAQSHGPAVTLPTPASDHLPTVAGMSSNVTPDAVVMLTSSLTPDQIASLSKLRGVSRVETVDTGTVSLGASPVVAFGVNPASFRNFTPAASAASDQLWRYLAAGSLVSSYDMAGDRSLKLGTSQTIIPAASAPDSSVTGWLGAFASIGLPGVDLLVDHNYSRQLGLTPASGVIVAAPGLDGATLQSELQSALPGGAVELLHPDQLPTNLPGNSIGSATRQKILAAALSRVGLPYVWGATGPDSFDCSGLVQWSFRQAGILMPRVAAEQFLTGDHIPLAAAQPGDLLFWTYDPADPGYVDHVAIYLGNGQMVVAPHTGTDVQVAPVPTQDFAGAVQVVLAS
ncbi:MAG TPA: C40 family peptidase [Acidimicrobiales bacterium]|nr:C40 family peptidase [Acidimicrobiales bacterium]